MLIRAITYNVHKCIGSVDRRYDPERIERTIAHYAPDVVLLQEVAQGARRYRGDKQVERIARHLGYRNQTYFVNVRWRRRGEYGNAILSRFPIMDTSNIPVTVPPRKARSILHARIRVRIGAKSRTLHVFNMHLGLSGAERKLQLEKFLASHPFAGLDPRTPILVGGDLNDVWGTLGRRFLVPRGFDSSTRAIPTFPAYAPVRALDGVFVRGTLRLRHLHASRLDEARYASDHLPLVADLEITRR